MLGQKVSKLFPLLVAMSLISALAGAVLGQQYYTRCSESDPGWTNRTFDCKKWDGCRVGPQGTCDVGGVQVSPQSGDMSTEHWYEYCTTFTQEAKCVEDDTESICLSYRGFLDSSTCTSKGDNTCTASVKKKDCHTEF
jgi:hypothetical protein